MVVKVVATVFTIKLACLVNNGNTAWVIASSVTNTEMMKLLRQSNGGTGAAGRHVWWGQQIARAQLSASLAATLLGKPHRGPPVSSPLPPLLRTSKWRYLPRICDTVRTTTSSNSPFTARSQTASVRGWSAQTLMYAKWWYFIAICIWKWWLLQLLFSSAEPDCAYYALHT